MNEETNYSRLGCFVVVITTFILWVLIAIAVGLSVRTASSQTVCCAGGKQLWPCAAGDAACSGPMGLGTCAKSLGTVTAAPCAGGTPVPTPTATPSPTKTPVPGWTPVPITQVTGFTMPTTAFWYAPDCIVWPPPVIPPALPASLSAAAALQQSDPYWCWPTHGDAISLYTSMDRTHWSMRQQALVALPGTWEDNGNRGFSYPNGISNMVVSRSRTNGRLIAAYTAGQYPAVASGGGVGLAYSDDGIRWTRYAYNPILTASPTYAFAQRLLRIADRMWLYVGDVDGNVGRVPIADPEGTPYGSLVPLPGLKGTVLLGYDQDGCWLSEGVNWVDVGWSSMNIYRAGDCVADKGDLFAILKASDYGYKGIMHVALVERSLEGGILGGPTLLLSVGSSWATWTPTAVWIGTQRQPWVQPPFIPSWRPAP